MPLTETYLGSSFHSRILFYHAQFVSVQIIHKCVSACTGYCKYTNCGQVAFRQWSLTVPSACLQHISYWYYRSHWWKGHAISVHIAVHITASTQTKPHNLGFAAASQPYIGLKDTILQGLNPALIDRLPLLQSFCQEEAETNRQLLGEDKGSQVAGSCPFPALGRYHNVQNRNWLKAHQGQGNITASLALPSYPLCHSATPRITPFRSIPDTKECRQAKKHVSFFLPAAPASSRGTINTPLIMWLHGNNWP